MGLNSRSMEWVFTVVVVMAVSDQCIQVLQCWPAPGRNPG
jgi:hypothetical protein